MAQPYPLPRSTRETEINLGDGRATYGPFDFKIFDTVDVRAFVQRNGKDDFEPEPFSVTKVAGQIFDNFTITFEKALSVGERYIVSSARLHERQVAITRGGTISAVELEKELSKQGSVLEELRRDIDRGGSLVALSPGQVAIAGQDGRMRPGPFAIDIAGAQKNAVDAQNAADRAGGYAAMQSADKVKFKTVAELLANTTMSYTDEPGKIHVGPGDVVEADGHRFRVVNFPVADYHVTTAGGVKFYVIDSPTVTVEAFGAIFSGDESAIAAAMIAALGILRVPRGRVLTAKNIELAVPARLEVDGTLRLPDGCADDDRLIYADQVSNITGYIHEIDGNYDGQSGNIGTHLVYLTRCPRAKLRVGTVRDHYISSGAPMPSNDGFRNTSTGAVWLYQCVHADVSIDYIHGWGREAFYAQDCEDGTFSLGFAQGHATRNTEYSALQVSGARNKVLRAAADFCGASSVGFDTVNGEIGNILVTNTRVNAGVNFGHPGRPATGSIASNIVVDGAWGAGIIAAAATKDLKLANFSVQNTGERGLQMSDNADGLVAVNGRVAFPGRWNIVSGGVGAELSLASVRSDELDPMVLHISAASGLFEDGETVTGPNGSGVIRKVLRNLTGVQQKLFLASSSGAFSAPQVVTGGTSGASGTIDIAAVPVQYNEGAGSFIVDDSRLITGPSGRYVRHADGTAEWWAFPVVPATANVDAVLNVIFNAGMTWLEPPVVIATLRGAISSNSFEISKLQAVANTSQATIRLNASATQDYLVSLYARGRWRT